MATVKTATSEAGMPMVFLACTYLPVSHAKGWCIRLLRAPPYLPDCAPLLEV